MVVEYAPVATLVAVLASPPIYVAFSSFFAAIKPRPAIVPRRERTAVPISTQSTVLR